MVEDMSRLDGTVNRLSMNTRKLLKALSDKETVALSEVDAFMENCAKGGRLKRLRTNFSDDVCQTLETRLSIQVQISVWLTSKHG